MSSNNPKEDAATSQTTKMLLDAPQRKKRITVWMTLCLVALGVRMFFTVVNVSMEGFVLLGLPNVDRPIISSIISVISGLFYHPCSVAYLIFYFFYLRRLWEEVPRQFARTTPEQAASLSLIPFFNWYWMFVALGGLYQGMNKTLEFYGHNRRFHTTLIIAACIIWLIADLLYILSYFVAGIFMLSVFDYDPDNFLETVMAFGSIFAIFHNILWFIFTFIMYWMIRKNVIEFVDIKASLG